MKAKVQFSCTDIGERERVGKINRSYDAKVSLHFRYRSKR